MNVTLAVLLLCTASVAAQTMTRPNRPPRLKRPLQTASDNRSFDTHRRTQDLPADFVCADDPNFDIGWGPCSTYGPGFSNDGYCEGDGAVEPCPISCGVCVAVASFEVSGETVHDCSTRNSWQIHMDGDGWGEAQIDISDGSTQLMDNLRFVDAENINYADAAHIQTVGGRTTANICLAPATCYTIIVNRGSDATSWSIRDSYGIEVTSNLAGSNQHVCHCGHVGGMACHDCTAIIPQGGATGSCNDDLVLAHHGTCVANCPNGHLPQSCWNGTITRPIECCQAGTGWDGATMCSTCPAGKHDHDNSAYTPCVDCPAGKFSDTPTQCTTCPIGTFASTGSVTCIPCVNGMADSDQDPATPCTLCYNALTQVLDTTAPTCSNRGCTDDFAENYDPVATLDDGSCVYDCNKPLSPGQESCSAATFETGFIAQTCMRRRLACTSEFSVPTADMPFIVDFTAVVDSAGGRSTSITTFDLDVDGYMDVFVTNHQQENRILYGNGKGIFTEVPSGSQPPVQGDGFSYAGAAADLDGDGLPELIVGNDGQANQIFAGVGHRSYTEASVLPAGTLTESRSVCVVAEDLNGDSKIDLFFCSLGGPNQLYINVGTGPGDLSFTEVFTGAAVEGTEDATGAVTGDWDSDGATDLFVVHDNGSNNQLILQVGTNGGVTGPSSSATSDGASSKDAASIDLDGDTFFDLVVACDGRNQVFYGQGDGTFIEDLNDSNPIFSRAADSQSVEAADINGDGAIDIYIGNTLAANEVFYGSVTAPRQFVQGFGAIVMGSDDTYDASLVDLDSDGYPDIYCTNFRNQNNALFFSRQDPSPTKLVGRGIEGAMSYAVNVADFNSDGCNDVYISNYDTESELKFGDCNAHFFAVLNDPAVTHGVSTTISITEDLNGDGFTDIFCAKFFGLNNRLFLNDGTGAFIEKLTGPAVTSAGMSKFAASADFNADGLQDIYVTNYGQLNELYLQHDGELVLVDGPHACDGDSNAVAFGDLNGDGFTDILVLTFGFTQKNRMFLNSPVSPGTSFTEILSSPLVDRPPSQYPDGKDTCVADAAGDCAGITTQVDCNADVRCTYIVADGVCQASDASFCSAQAANGADACDGAGDCTYTANDGLEVNSGRIHDFDGDGDDDVLILIAQMPDRLFINEGSGTFREQFPGDSALADVFTSEALPTKDSVLIDVNNDQVQDLFLGLSGTADKLYVADGLGGFESDDTFSLLGAGDTVRATAADLDADGRQELIVVNRDKDSTLFTFSTCQLGYKMQPDPSLALDRSCYACPSYSTGVEGAGNTQQCTFCPAGRVGPPGMKAITELYLCLPCEAGKSRAGDEASDVCVDCAVGLYSSSGASKCISCEPGKVPNSLTGGASACSPCPTGSEPDAAQLGCNVCPGNTVSAFGLQCTLCGTGKVANDAHATCMPLGMTQITDAGIVASFLSSSTRVLPKLTLTGENLQASDELLTEFLTATFIGISDQVKPADITVTSHEVGATADVVLDFAGPDGYYLNIDNVSASLQALGFTTTYTFTCPVGLYRPTGSSTCQVCPGAATPDKDTGFSTCRDCPQRQVPYVATFDGTTEYNSSNVAERPSVATCKCGSGFYSAINRSVGCHDMDYVDNTEHSQVTECKACGEELECVSTCRGDSLEVKPGWMATIADHEVKIFACKGGDTACIGGPVTNTKCGPGYDGLLCAVCAAGYHEDSDGCVPCEEMTALGAIVAAITLALVLVLAWKVTLWYNYFTLVSQLAEFFEELDLRPVIKQLTATFQILASLGPVLSISFPAIFSGLLGKFAAFFKIDIAVLFGLGCYSVSSYALSLFFNLATVAALCVLILGYHRVQLYRMLAAEQSPEDVREGALRMYNKFDPDGNGIELEEVKLIVQKVDPDVTDASVTKLFNHADKDNTGKIDFEEFFAAVNSEHTDEFSLHDLILDKRRFDLRADALGRLFLLVFVMYPGLTNKIFAGFMCRYLGDDVWVMQEDYGTECYTSEWYAIAGVCGVLMLLWPIGLPALLYIKIRAAVPLIQQGDEDTIKFWHFAIGDYAKNHWYWEVVELLRKMIMAGLLGLLGRGTIFQTFIGTVISFFFFAFALRTMPYESQRLNFVKLFSEAQLYIIMLTCLCLQVDSRRLANQWIGDRSDFGVLQVVCALASFPLALVFMVHSINEERAMRRATKGSERQRTVNPLERTVNPLDDEMDTE